MFGGQRRNFLAGLFAVLFMTLEPSCARGGSPGVPKVLDHGKQASHAVFVVEAGTPLKVTPEHGYIWIGSDADNVRELWWVFTFDFDHATISSKDPGVFETKVCEPNGKVSVCKLKIKKEGIPKGTYQYSIHAYDSSNKEIGHVDPDIEVDK